MKYEDYLKADIVEKLGFWVKMPRGETLPTDWPNINEWDMHIREVCAEAAVWILRCRLLHEKIK